MQRQVYAVDRRRGTRLWDVRTGDQLFRSSSSAEWREETDAEAEDDVSLSSSMMVLPAADGSLYIVKTSHSRGEAEGEGGEDVQGTTVVRRFPLTAEQLVAASPLYSEDASTVFLGSKTSTVFVVHPLTGEVNEV